MRRFVIIIFLLISCTILVSPHSVYAAVAPPGLGFGVCHWPGTAGLGHREAVNWFYWGGGAEDWVNIEPQRGQYSFAKLDKQLNDHFKRYPETSFWLDIMTAMPSSLPDWAKQDPSLSYIEYNSRASTFAIWDPDFQRAFEALQTKVSEYIYSSDFKYRDKLKAIIMMSGGGFGEMITWASCPDGKGCKMYLDAGYTDEVYMDAMVNWLVPLYARLFPDYPLVLQLGGGIYGKVGGKVASALVDKYGSRIYVKWNGWNRKFAQEPTNTDKYYHNVMSSLSDRAMVGFEPGYAWAIPDNTSDAMRQSIYDSISKTLDEVPVSYFCLQNKYFEILTTNQLLELSRKFKGLQIQYPPFGSGPRATNTPFPTETPKPSPTSPPEATPTQIVVQTTVFPVTEPTNPPPQSYPTSPPTEYPTSQPVIPDQPKATENFIPLALNKKPILNVNAKELVCRDGLSVRGGISSMLQFPKNILDFLITTDANIELYFVGLIQNYSLPSRP